MSDHDVVERCATALEQLAARVRETPPYNFEINDQAGVRDVPAEESGNYHYRVRESTGSLETTVTIRWQP